MPMRGARSRKANRGMAIAGACLMRRALLLVAGWRTGWGMAVAGACLMCLLPAASAEAGLSPAELAALVQVCEIADPAEPAAAFQIERGQPDERGDYWVRYACKRACADWRKCAAAAHDPRSGKRIDHVRQAGLPKRQIAFVVDGMGGHLAFSADEGGGDKTIFLQSGGGGTGYLPHVADMLEAQTRAHTAMAAWADGFMISTPYISGDEGWGWLTRPGEAPAGHKKLTRRMAAIIAWTHEQLAGDGMFGTAACSLGANATFGPVYWYGLDSIIDYQLLTGGPFIWDINAGCGRRKYALGYCANDGVTRCTGNEPCGGQGNYCDFTSVMGSGDEFLYEAFANHPLATDACHILDEENNAEPYPPFDENSMAFTEGDWELNHEIDLVVDLGGKNEVDGERDDSYSQMGHFFPIFNAIQPARNRHWTAFHNSYHCQSFDKGWSIGLIIDGMALERR